MDILGYTLSIMHVRPIMSTSSRTI